MMPIKLVQTTSEVPRYGASTREPVNSITMTTAPHRKTEISSKHAATLRLETSKNGCGKE